MAAFDFDYGDLIAVNPVIVYPCLGTAHRLQAWAMDWRDTEDAIAPGVINLLNHKTRSSCRLENDYKRMEKRLYAKRPIARGEELTISYACELWFTPVED